MKFKNWLENKHHVDFVADTTSGGRAIFTISFSENPPPEVVSALVNNLDKQGWYQQGNLLKFYQPNNHVNNIVFDLAKQTLHRMGYQRFDDVWHDKETADELFGFKY